MENFFKTIFGRIKPDHTLRSLHTSPNNLEESTSNELEESKSHLTFICPGCGFYLQLSSAPFVETSNRPKLTETPEHPTTNQIAVFAGPLNMVPHPHHVILPPTTDQTTAFKEALNTLPYLPRTNPQPDTQSSPLKMSSSSQFKFPIHKWEHLTLPGHPVVPVSDEYSSLSDERACAMAFFIGLS